MAARSPMPAISSRRSSVLERAHSPDQPDWRILSVQGAVLDQMGRHEEAQRYYASALRIVPEEPSVLSNLGLSYALSKDLPRAEETLRRASARGSTDKRVRQNLALVVGLQGRFQDAEAIARADLPPDQAAENVAYLRRMMVAAAEGRSGAEEEHARAGSGRARSGRRRRVCLSARRHPGRAARAGIPCRQQLKHTGWPFDGRMTSGVAASDCR